MDELAVQLDFWHWLVMGVVFVTFEMFVPGAFFMGMGVSALVVAVLLLGFPSLGWEAQIVVFAVLSLLSVVAMRRYIARRPIESEQPLLNQRGAQYVGRTFTLDAPIVNGQGKIKVDDSIWKVHAGDCDAGTRIVITGVDGVVLEGRPAED